MLSTLNWPADFGGIIGKPEGTKRVIFCTPTITKPYKQYLESLERSIPLIKKEWDEGSVWQIGCPYISAARSLMLRKALDVKADVIVFIDHDLSWDPQDLLTLIETPGDVVAGTYRYKKEPEEYMGGLLPDPDGKPQVREDGCIKAFCIPAGFLKITRNAVNKFISAYPELVYGEQCNPHIDLFNHGVHNRIWYGEDYAFSRNWTEKCGDIWIVPNLNITHWAGDTPYPGNFHNFLLKQPGGSECASST